MTVEQVELWTKLAAINYIIVFFYYNDLHINEEHHFKNIYSVNFLPFPTLYIHVHWTLQMLIKDAVNIYDEAFEKIVNF